jgi:2-furoyl-CoA dehydrogenase large subunit
LNVETSDVVFVDGSVSSKTNPENKISFSRLAALSHWSPGSLPDDVGNAIRETVFWTPPELTAPDEHDHINSSLCHGFIFDFCGVEIDRTTLATRIDRYVTMHDCGTILHPGMVDGQIRGGFTQALGAALYEEYAYAPDGSFLTGTFADYLLPTTTEVPEPLILHMETPSPFTPLGSKGVGEEIACPRRFALPMRWPMHSERRISFSPWSRLDLRTLCAALRCSACWTTA